VPCPDCGGGLAERKTRFGKPFWGCVNYPNCKFASWDRPLPEKCPQCGKSFLVSKYSKRDGAYIACRDKECGYRREAPEPGGAETQPPASL
jgi:DNA topoisomerase-1